MSIVSAETFEIEAHRSLDRYLMVPNSWSCVFAQTKDYLMTCEDKCWDIFTDNENKLCDYIDFIMSRTKRNTYSTNMYGEISLTVGKSIIKHMSMALSSLAIVLKELCIDDVKPWKTKKVATVQKTWDQREASRVTDQYLDKALLASKDYEPSLDEIMGLIAACWNQGSTWGAVHPVFNSEAYAASKRLLE
jgi:hypothetical protein